MYTVSCPYHKGETEHEIRSEYWDEVDEQLERCRERASAVVRGAIETFQLSRSVPETK